MSYLSSIKVILEFSLFLRYTCLLNILTSVKVLLFSNLIARFVVLLFWGEFKHHVGYSLSEDC